MKKLVGICVLLLGLGVAMAPAHASALQVVDFPQADLMITYAAQDYDSTVNIKGCGQFSLKNLVDYSEGSDRAVTLPWNHAQMTQDEWAQLEGWFKAVMEKKCGKESKLSALAPEAVFYEADSSQVKDRIKNAEAPVLSKYVLEKEHNDWWPPTAPEKDPF